MKRKKVGIALGSGGGKGLAHIGVLKVLEKQGIPIDYIAGTSIGAVIGALYAAEPNAKKLEKEALEGKWSQFFDYTLSKSGFIKGKKIENFLKTKLNNVQFKDLKIPLLITAFDIEGLREVVFSKGDVAKALRASISIPGIFIPVQNKNTILVDGAILDPIPTEVLRRAGVDIIIAVNVNELKCKKPLFDQTAVNQKGKKELPNILSIASRVYDVMGSEECKFDTKTSDADFVINVDLKNVGMLDFSKPAKSIKAGERATKRSLSRLKELTTPSSFKLFLEDIRKNLDIKNLDPKRIARKFGKHIKNI